LYKLLQVNLVKSPKVNFKQKYNFNIKITKLLIPIPSNYATKTVSKHELTLA